MTDAIATASYGVGYGQAVPGQGTLALDASSGAARWKPLSEPHAGASTWATDAALPFGAVATHQFDRAMPWSRRQARDRMLAERFGQIAAHDHHRALRWAQARDLVDRDLGTPWRQPAPHARAEAAGWDVAEPRERSLAALWRQLAAHGAFVALPWGPIGSRSSSIGGGWPVDPNPPPIDDGGDPITVPLQCAYIMIPTISAIVVPSGASLPILNAVIQGDNRSWAWSFTAAVPASALPLVDPAASDTPATIMITINGYAWTFIVEGVDDNRRFGNRTLTLRGRSRSAELGLPYAPMRTYTQGSELLASQLANNELTPYGWTLLWQTVDWLLPSGTLSYQDLAPIDALARIAAAAGATVQPDPNELTLTVQPEYKASPWDWAGTLPYAIIPANILTQGDGSWQGGINANGVYVYSENAGFGAFVRIAGTDGSTQVPMVVERLAVSADPARELGRIELSRAGRIKTETRVIPLFPSPAAPGLIPVGELLQVGDSETEAWTGLVTGVRINADRNGSAISVRQTLTLERQFRPAP